MFGKDKVKSYNRVAKGKNGFKVIRVNDFFRKKDESRNKKIALGVAGAGLLVGAGIGSALLLKGKRTKNLLTPKTNVPINQVSKVAHESKKVPITTSTTSKLTPKKEFSKLEDPWESPIVTKIQKEKSLVMNKPEVTKLLSPAKPRPKSRDLLEIPQRKIKSVEERVIQVSSAQKDYKSLPVEMQTILQVEKALRAPTKISSLGRPPERTSIVQLVDNSGSKLDKATRKVKERLSREKAISDEAVKKKQMK